MFELCSSCDSIDDDYAWTFLNYCLFVKCLYHYVTCEFVNILKVDNHNIQWI